jgi:hypothetical protein
MALVRWVPPRHLPPFAANGMVADVALLSP